MIRDDIKNKLYEEHKKIEKELAEVEKEKRTLREDVEALNNAHSVLNRDIDTHMHDLLCYRKKIKENKEEIELLKEDKKHALNKLGLDND